MARRQRRAHSVFAVFVSGPRNVARWRREFRDLRPRCRSEAPTGRTGRRSAAARAWRGAVPERRRSEWQEHENRVVGFGRGRLPVARIPPEVDRASCFRKTCRHRSPRSDRRRTLRESLATDGDTSAEPIHELTLRRGPLISVTSSPPRWDDESRPHQTTKFSDPPSARVAFASMRNRTTESGIGTTSLFDPVGTQSAEEVPDGSSSGVQVSVSLSVLVE